MQLASYFLTFANNKTNANFYVIVQLFLVRYLECIYVDFSHIYIFYSTHVKHLDIK